MLANANTASATLPYNDRPRRAENAPNSNGVAYKSRKAANTLRNRPPPCRASSHPYRSVCNSSNSTSAADTGRWPRPVVSASDAITSASCNTGTKASPNDILPTTARPGMESSCQSFGRIPSACRSSPHSSASAVTSTFSPGHPKLSGSTRRRSATDSTKQAVPASSGPGTAPPHHRETVLGLTDQGIPTAAQRSRTRRANPDTDQPSCAKRSHSTSLRPPLSPDAARLPTPPRPAAVIAHLRIEGRDHRGQRAG